MPFHHNINELLYGKYIYEIDVHDETSEFMDLLSKYDFDQYICISGYYFRSSFKLLTNNKKIFNELRNQKAVISTAAPKTLTHEKYLLDGYIISHKQSFDDLKTWYRLSFITTNQVINNSEFLKYVEDGKYNKKYYPDQLHPYKSILDFKNKEEALYAKLKFSHLGENKITKCVLDQYLVELNFTNYILRNKL